MTRIQILPLPSVVVGDSLEEPFALIVDQHTATGGDDPGRWERFKADCGARAVLVTPETVEVVDRYAETPPHDDQDQGEDAATRGPNSAARPEGLGPAPCPDWSHGIEHPAHEWDASVDGRVSCPGWTPPADPTLEADRADPEVTQLVARWPKLATRAERGEGVTASAHTGPFIQMGVSDVDPFKVAAELRFHLGKGRAPGQPTARQVIASTLRGDWVFAEEPDHIERVTDAILAALDEHGLDITRRDDGAPVPDARQRARDWIDGFRKAPEDDQVNCVALLLDAADAAYKCVAEGHKSRLAKAERSTSCPGQDRCTGDNCPDPKH